MRIAVDAREIYRPERRGMGNTLVQLYANLARIRPDWQFTLIHQLSASVPELKELGNVRRVRLDAPGAWRRNSWERLILPAAAWAMRVNLLHCPANTAPSRAMSPVVLTLHDLIPFEMDPSNDRWLTRVRSTARRASHILTGSEYTRNQFVTVLGLDAGRITVTPWAPAPNLKRVTDPQELERVRGAFGLSAAEPYLFGFGASDPRKNTARLIRAFARLPVGLRETWRLVLVGIQSDAIGKFRDLAVSAGVAARCLIREYVPEADLPALLSGATVVAFPSRSEGFGLPVLDAFVCGVALMTGDGSSLPEVAGGAAVLVDSSSDEAVRAGLIQLMTDEKLRETLVARGLARVAEFDWTRTATATADVFEQVACRSRRREIHCR